MTREDIGQKIRSLRKERKDSLKSLAKKVNYDYSNLSKVERGIYEVPTELLQRIISVYDVDPNYFFGGNFTESEGELLIEDNLNPSDLKKKYKFVVDGIEASDKEIEEAIRLIRYLRPRESGFDSDSVLGFGTVTKEDENKEGR